MLGIAKILFRKRKEGNTSLLSTFVCISVDNVGFLQSHAAVYSGDQHQSWQDTTVQVLILENNNSGVNISVAAQDTADDQSPPNSVELSPNKQATQSLAATAQTTPALS